MKRYLRSFPSWMYNTCAIVFIILDSVVCDCRKFLLTMVSLPASVCGKSFIFSGMSKRRITFERNYYQYHNSIWITSVANARFDAGSKVNNST
jgi:hypothetical protein